MSRTHSVVTVNLHFTGDGIILRSNIYQSPCWNPFQTGKQYFLSTGKCKYKYLPMLKINLCHVCPTKWSSDHSFSPTITIARHPRELNEHMSDYTLHFLFYIAAELKIIEGGHGEMMEQSRGKMRRVGCFCNQGTPSYWAWGSPGPLQNWLFTWRSVFPGQQVRFWVWFSKMFLIGKHFVNGH